MTDARKRAWETRRKKYGARGHSGPYSAFVPVYSPPWNVRLRNMEQALIRLYRQGVLSEGQVSRATGMDRVSCRNAAIHQENLEKGKANAAD